MAHCAVVDVANPIEMVNALLSFSSISHSARQSGPIDSARKASQAAPDLEMGGMFEPALNIQFSILRFTKTPISVFA